MYVYCPFIFNYCCDPGTREADYAASKLTFEERVVEELDPSIIEAPLTRKNYKKKFHNMICWEEKRHIDILGEK